MSWYDELVQEPMRAAALTFSGHLALLHRTLLKSLMSCARSGVNGPLMCGVQLIQVDLDHLVVACAPSSGVSSALQRRRPPSAMLRSRLVARR